MKMYKNTLKKIEKLNMKEKLTKKDIKSLFCLLNNPDILVRLKVMESIKGNLKKIDASFLDNQIIENLELILGDIGNHGEYYDCNVTYILSEIENLFPEE